MSGDIHIGQNIIDTGGSGVLKLHAGGTGTISQGAMDGAISIGVSATAGGDVVLDNVSDQIGHVAGSAEAGSIFKLASNTNFDIGSVGGTDGITAAGAVYLITGGSITQTQPISADQLSVTTTGTGDVDLTYPLGNQVNKFAASVDDGHLAFTNGKALVIDSVGSGVDVSWGSVAIETTAGI